MYYQEVISGIKSSRPFKAWLTGWKKDAEEAPGRSFWSFWVVKAGGRYSPVGRTGLGGACVRRGHGRRCDPGQWQKSWGQAALVVQRFSTAFSPGCDPGDPGSSPMSGSLHGACFSLCLCCVSLSVCHEQIYKSLKKKALNFSKVLGFLIM